MKIKVVKTKPEFRPFTINIDVQTEEELHALLAMSLTNDTVPSVARQHWGKYLPDTKVLKTILCDLRDTLASEFEIEY